MLSKKETLAQVFFCEFCEILKNTFLQNTPGQLLLQIDQRIRRCSNCVLCNNRRDLFRLEKKKHLNMEKVGGLVNTIEHLKKSYRVQHMIRDLIWQRLLI